MGERGERACVPSPCNWILARRKNIGTTSGTKAVRNTTMTLRFDPSTGQGCLYQSWTHRPWHDGMVAGQRLSNNDHDPIESGLYAVSCDRSRRSRSERERVGSRLEVEVRGALQVKRPSRSARTHHAFNSGCAHLRLHHRIESRPPRRRRNAVPLVSPH